jgi:hypothetical protein
LRHRIARPLVPAGFIEATTAPGPSVWKAKIRPRPLFAPVWALSFIDVNTIVVRFAWRVGAGVGVGDLAGAEPVGEGGELEIAPEALGDG